MQRGPTWVLLECSLYAANVVVGRWALETRGYQKRGMRPEGPGAGNGVGIWRDDGGRGEDDGEDRDERDDGEDEEMDQQQQHPSSAHGKTSSQPEVWFSPEANAALLSLVEAAAACVSDPRGKGEG